jgi:hypothetical protein
MLGPKPHCLCLDEGRYCQLHSRTLTCGRGGRGLYLPGEVGLAGPAAAVNWRPSGAGPGKHMRQMLACTMWPDFPDLLRVEKGGLRPQ